MRLPEKSLWPLFLWCAAAWAVTPSCPIPPAPRQVLLEAEQSAQSRAVGTTSAHHHHVPCIPWVLQLALKLLSLKRHLCQPFPSPKHHSCPTAVSSAFPANKTLSRFPLKSPVSICIYPESSWCKGICSSSPSQPFYRSHYLLVH